MLDPVALLAVVPGDSGGGRAGFSPASLLKRPGYEIPGDRKTRRAEGPAASRLGHPAEKVKGRGVQAIEALCHGGAAVPGLCEESGEKRGSGLVAVR
jgi:hypothetical protein